MLIRARGEEMLHAKLIVFDPAGLTTAFLSPLPQDIDPVYVTDDPRNTVFAPAVIVPVAEANPTCQQLSTVDVAVVGNVVPLVTLLIKLLAFGFVVVSQPE